MQGKEGAISIGRNVVRALGVPQYVTLRVSHKNKALLIMPCEQKDVMSYKTPPDFINKSHVNFRIHSLSFVTGLLKDIGVDPEATFVLDGLYSHNMGAVVFPIDTSSLLE